MPKTDKGSNCFISWKGDFWNSFLLLQKEKHLRDFEKIN